MNYFSVFCAGGMNWDTPPQATSRSLKAVQRKLKPWYNSHDGDVGSIINQGHGMVCEFKTYKLAKQCNSLKAIKIYNIYDIITGKF